jgi:MT0933-like antitoxin protein
MGIFDKAKDVLNQHGDKVDQAVDKGADLADRRTGSQHGEQIDKGAELAKDKLDDYLRGNDPPA